MRNPSGKLLSHAAFVRTICIAVSAIRSLLLPILFMLALTIGGTFSARGQNIRGDLPVEITPIIAHTNYINSAAISPDGSRVLSGSNDNTVKLWDVETGRLLRTLSGHSSVVNSVAFSPDGRLVISGSNDKTARVWEVDTGKEIRSFPSSWLISSVAFSSDGKRILAYGNDIDIWDFASGSRLRSFPPFKTGALSSFAFSPDATRAAFGVFVTFYDTTISTLDISSGRTTVLSHTHAPAVADRTKTRTERVNSLAFSPDGRFLIAATQRDSEPREDLIKLWDVATGRLLRSWSGHSDSINSVAFSPDGERVATASADKTVRIWERATARLLLTFTEGENVKTAVFSREGTRVLSGGSDGSPLSLWDAATGRRIQTFNGRSAPVKAVEFSPDGKFLLSASDDNVTRFWDIETGRLLNTIGDSGDSATLSGDGARVVTGGDDTLKLWDSASGRLLRTFKGKFGAVTSIAFSHDGLRIAAGRYSTGNQGDKQVVELWDAGSGTSERVLTGYTNTVSAVAFSPDGRRLISGDLNGPVSIWNTATGRLLRSFIPFEGWSLASVAFSADGAFALLGGSGNGTSTGPANGLKLVETANWRTVRNLAGHSNTVSSVAFSTDGSRAFSGSWDGTIRLWDVATGRMIRTMRGHAGWVNSVASSPDGSRVASGSGDTTIRIWKADSGELLATFISSPDGEWLAITPEGFFAASEKGSDILSAVQGLQVYSIDQVYQSLYRPDLVREKLAGDPRGLVREAARRLDLSKVIASGRAPSVRIVSPANGSVAALPGVGAEIEVIDRGGGLGRVEWRLNGLTVGVDRPVPPPGGQPLRLARNFFLDAGDNELAIVAYNGSNLIASLPAQVTIAARPPGATPPPPGVSTPSAPLAPRLFVLAAGTDDYADRRFKLAYSVPDAEAVAAAFIDAGKGLYRSVEVKMMRDGDVTRDKLEQAFSELEKTVRPSDVFVLYLAGHGKTVDGRYYFVPQSFKIDGSLSEANIKTAVIAQGIAQDQWQRWFAAIPARKSLILFDTCESGTLTGTDDETKALERSAANDRLAQATGRSIITASSGNADALEGYHGHGLFTYNVLDAMDRGDSDSSGTIEVTELAAYVYAQVTAISEKQFNRRQEPQVKLNLNYSLIRQAHVLRDDAPVVTMSPKQKYQVSQVAALRIKPVNGASVVRSISPNTVLTVLRNEGPWSLVAQEGRPVGYVATRDLAPAH